METDLEEYGKRTGANVDRLACEVYFVFAAGLEEHSAQQAMVQNIGHEHKTRGPSSWKAVVQ